ncbi:CD48 antigen isoform X2 [Castor canadensis]|uniref:CD48 antigen isoform X2 n=1 Tax=Castor canadensis TaxID=51338 RepID=A0AC58KFU9_CASCN
MYPRRWELYLTLDILLLPLLVTSNQDTSQIVMSGSNVSLQISEIPKNFTHLTWLHTTKQKIVEWTLGETPNYFQSRFKDKVILDPESAVLHIKEVGKEENGIYLLRVLMQNGSEKERKITLKVIDPVPKPVIKIEKIQKLDDNCYLNLSCLTQNESVDYLWYRDSGPFSKELQRSVLEVIINPQNQSKFYTCQVSNPVSSKNDTLYFIPPCDLGKKCLQGC